jgi:hypothetical protein
LENLKKRLDLLYPDHSLIINNDASWFTVTLHLKMKEFTAFETENTSK